MGLSCQQQLCASGYGKEETAHEKRSRRTAEMNELIRKFGYKKEKLIELGYADVLGEATDYNEPCGTWSTRGSKGKNEPKWFWKAGMRDDEF